MLDSYKLAPDQLQLLNNWEFDSEVCYGKCCVLVQKFTVLGD